MVHSKRVYDHNVRVKTRFQNCHTVEIERSNPDAEVIIISGDSEDESD